MSKYVRTTDGIIESTQTVRRSKVVKYGETIEELCDAAVVEWENDETPGCYEYIDKDVLLALLKTIDGINIYGAIYIKGKGLIYVAKMNEKGEFELL